MKKEEKEEKVVKAWEEYRDLLKKRKDAEQVVKELKEEEEVVKGLLVSLVPEGGEVAGVAHKIREKVSISYGKLFEAVIEEVVPKTKRGKAEELKEEYTSRRVQHEIREGK